MTDQDASLGDLVAAATQNLSTLMKQEVQLAKIEIKREVVAAGKGAGLLGGAGALGALGGIFVSIALAYALNEVLPTFLSFLLVGVVYLVVAGLLALIGKKSLSKVGPPEKTIATVKDDVAWAKHPTVAPTKTLDEGSRR
jgi:nitrate/nitrite transporter NarK